MEQNRKEKLLAGIKITAFFLVLFGVFYFYYHSPFSYFRGSYGVLEDVGKTRKVENLWDAATFVYMHCVRILYLFLGEKQEILLGFHIFLRILNSVFLFACFLSVKRLYPSILVVGIYGVLSLMLGSLYEADAAIIAEAFLCLVFAVIVLMLRIIVHRVFALKNRRKEPGLSYAMTGQDLKNGLAGDEITYMEKKESTNFLDISDEEIRRNAMIAAGLLTADTNVAAEVNRQENTALNGKKQDEEKTVQNVRNLSHTQFIENPLPVPKRHVKKEMDYEYQVPENKLYFDIEEPEKNYYDLE